MVLSPSLNNVPPKGVACLYLFGNSKHCKVGRTIDLAKRALKYVNMPGDPLKFLAYCGPFDNVQVAEQELIKHFDEAFEKFVGNEWFQANACEGLAAFSQWTNRLIHSEQRETMGDGVAGD